MSLRSEVDRLERMVKDSEPLKLERGEDESFGEAVARTLKAAGLEDALEGLSPVDGLAKLVSLFGLLGVSRNLDPTLGPPRERKRQIDNHKAG